MHAEAEPKLFQRHAEAEAEAEAGKYTQRPGYALRWETLALVAYHNSLYRLY
jgi:hypothetical protein